MERMIVTIGLSIFAALASGSTAFGAELVSERGDFPNTFAAATPLSLPNGTARVLGLIGTTDVDVDFLQFDGLAGDWLVLDTDRADLPLDTVLSLFDPSGTLVAFNDDNDGNGSDNAVGDVIAPFQLPFSGTYRVAVSSYANYPNAYADSIDSDLSWSGVTTEVVSSNIGNSTFDNDGRGETGSYDLIVSRFRPVERPINETNDFSDDRISAFNLGTGVLGSVIQINGKISTENDIDFLKLTLNGGDILYADTDTLTPELDTELSLFNSSGVLVAFNDDNEGNGSDANGFGTVIAPFTIPSDGDYFLAVTSFPNEPNALSSSVDTDLIISGQRTNNVGPDDSFNFEGGEAGDYNLLLFLEDGLFVRSNDPSSTSVPESSMTLALIALSGLAVITKFGALKPQRFNKPR